MKKLLKKQFHDLQFGFLSGLHQVHNNRARKLFDQQFSSHTGNEAGLAQLIAHSDKETELQEGHRAGVGMASVKTVVE